MFILISYLIAFLIIRLFLLTPTILYGSITFLLYQYRINQQPIYLIKSFINYNSVVARYNYTLEQLIKLLQKRRQSVLKLRGVRIGFKISIYNIFRGNQYAFIIILPLARLIIKLLLRFLILFIAIIPTFQLLYNNQILSLCLRDIQSYLLAFFLIRAIYAEPFPNGLYQTINYSFFYFISPVNILLLQSCLVSYRLYIKGQRTQRT